MAPRTGVAVVTGAGSGIGRDFARALLAAGWSVALIGRRAAALEETAAGHAALVLPLESGFANDTLELLGQWLRQGLRHQGGGLGSRANAQVERLRQAGLARCATLLQAAHDGLVLRQSLSADCQDDGDDGRQSLGDGRHRDPHHRKEDLVERLPQPPIGPGEEQRRHAHDHRRRHRDDGVQQPRRVRRRSTRRVPGTKVHHGDDSGHPGAQGRQPHGDGAAEQKTVQLLGVAAGHSRPG